MEQATANTKPNLERLRSALETVAELVVVDPVYSPIFARLRLEWSVLLNRKLWRCSITACEAVVDG